MTTEEQPPAEPATGELLPPEPVTAEPVQPPAPGSVELAIVLKKSFLEILAKHDTLAMDTPEDRETLAAVLSTVMANAISKSQEQATVQLAGCMVAAQGGTSQSQRAHPGMYGWSPAYEAVLRLALKYEDALKAKKILRRKKRR